MLDRAGSVDLALEHPRRSLAVEITVTTTIDHEVGNVSKCLKAGFPVVSSSETKLRQLQEAVNGALGPELAACVGYFLPDAFLVHLGQLAQQDASQAPPPAERQTLGYKVTLAADAHSTFDTPILPADKIIAHRNRLLSGIVQSVKPAAEIVF